MLIECIFAILMRFFFLNQVMHGERYEKDYIYRLLMSYIKPTPFYPVGVSNCSLYSERQEHIDCISYKILLLLLLLLYYYLFLMKINNP